jgi:hypothetical protein
VYTYIVRTAPIIRKLLLSKLGPVHAVRARTVGGRLLNQNRPASTAKTASLANYVF